MAYRPVTPEVVSRLAEIVGPAGVSVDPEALDLHGRDETEDLVFRPEVVVSPAEGAQVARVLALANDLLIPVTPRGGGTGLSGGALPVFGGISLSLAKMSRVVEIDRANLQAVVEPGVVTQTFQEQVEAVGLFYPPDPASRGSCHLGGNLAECAGGPRAVKYGVTKDYVLGLEAALPDGTLISCGGRVLKNASGYNLAQLIIGSEGTLAVITRIVLRLIPLPRRRKVLLAAFDSPEGAAGAVASIFQRGITPSALEFMERAAVQVAEERLGKRFPNGQAAAQLFIEVDGNHEDALAADVEGIASVVGEHGALDVLIAEDAPKVAEVWALRRGIGEAVKSISAYREEDTVVPRVRLPELIRGVKEICARTGVTSICYGHAGDGNLHVNLLKGELDERAWRERADGAVREILGLAVSLGGTISGEHGIGLTQRGYLPLAVGPAELAIMRSIKRLFDPKGILNPGKIFPDG